MLEPFVHINHLDLEDDAPRAFGAHWEARGARAALQARDTGLTHFRLRPGKRSPFTHRHRGAEEIYVVVGGSGRIKVDDAVRTVRPLDAIRVAARASRAFEAGPDGLEFIAVGAHHPGDGESVDDPWTDAAPIA
jgi:mannose-6-phosphate isomerase-like protein (cupin superfamily)